MPRSWLWGSILLLALVACGDDDSGGTHEDAGTDAGGSHDAGRDAGDAGRDGGRDAGPDASRDGGTPSHDAGGMDAASDAAPSDSGTSGIDAAEVDASDLDANASEADASERDAGDLDATGASDDGSTTDASTDSSTAEDAGSDSGPSETFDALYADIIMQRCAGCHVAGHRSGLDLSSKQVAYMDLVDVDAGEGESGAGSACDQMGFKRVVAGDADASLLVLKVVGSPPQCGSRMPTSGSPLTSQEIARIRAWIDQGAPAPTMPDGQ